MKIFIDMDGTIARFYEADDCLEKMYEPGFFKDLKPYKKAIKLINKLHDKGYDIYLIRLYRNCLLPTGKKYMAQ